MTVAFLICSKAGALGVSSQELASTDHHEPQRMPFQIPSLPGGTSTPSQGPSCGVSLMVSSWASHKSSELTQPSGCTSVPRGHGNKESEGTKARRHPTKQERGGPPTSGCLPLSREPSGDTQVRLSMEFTSTRPWAKAGSELLAPETCLCDLFLLVLLVLFVS